MTEKKWKQVEKDFWKKIDRTGQFSYSIRITKANDRYYYVRSPHSSEPEPRAFKTRSKALAYARQYMKTH